MSQITRPNEILNVEPSCQETKKDKSSPLDIWSKALDIFGKADALFSSRSKDLPETWLSKALLERAAECIAFARLVHNVAAIAYAVVSVVVAILLIVIFLLCIKHVPDLDSLWQGWLTSL